MASNYTVKALPQRYWRGKTVEEWGLEAGGQWLTWPPDGEPARFVSAAWAKSYARENGLPLAEESSAGHV